MKRNMGSIDRMLRIFGAGIIALAYFTISLSGTLAVTLGIVAVAFIITSFIGFCPLYAILKVSARHSRPQTNEEAAR